MTEKKTVADYRDEAQAGQMQVEQAVSQLELQGAAQQKASAYTQERDLVNQVLGRAQLAHGLAKVLTVASLQDLKRVKEEKLYQRLSGFPIVLASGELLTVSTWAGFCQALGVSHKTVDEQLRNLNAIGADALESMNRIGLGYRDLRKLRKLPEDEQHAIVGEVEANVGDKEAIVALIDDMAAKHVKETDALKAELDAAKADVAAKDRFVEEQGQKINELSTRLNRDPTPNEYEKQERDWMHARRGDLVAASMRCSREIAALGDVISVIREHESSLSMALLEDLPAQVSAVAQDLSDIVARYAIEVDVAEIIMPSWLREDASGQPGETQ